MPSSRTRARRSSPTSSRTTASSSTPDPALAGGGDHPITPAARLAGLVRLGHPFPSLLDAAVTAVVAGIAGAAPSRALLLAAAMLLLQLAIGAANDLADVDADRASKPGKPIPTGLVGERGALAVAAAAAGGGLLLAALMGPWPLAVALAGLAVGLAYDLRLKGTRWSPLPFAIGIPLLPVFAWVGATGALPTAFAVLVPVAAAAGLALAVANALADLERDLAAGTRTIATSLGLAAARRVGAALEATVVATALGSAVVLGDDGEWLVAVIGGGALVGVGVAAGWGAGPAARQRAWELQAAGLGTLAAGWVGSLASAGRLAG